MRRPGVACGLALLVVFGSWMIACSETGGGAVAPLQPLSINPGAPTAAGTALVVAGNQLVDRDGLVVRLLGVNRSGTQYACTDGTGVFDGPTDAAAVDAMVSWGITAVRVSLNEHCWLGVNGLPVGYPAADYRRAVVDFVDQLTAKGLAVVVDLHWNAPGTTPARGQQPMADRDHAPAFWRSVAATFKQRGAVLFDLYNEPYPDGNRGSDAAWRCVRDGGTCPGVAFVAAGMQELVDAVRSTGARNPILVGGPQYAGVLDRWLEFRPHDPLGQLIASIHIYGPDGSPCWTAQCWDGVLAPLADRVPVVVGEMGNLDCTTTVVDPLMRWADRAGVGYLAWSWITGSCSREPALISNYDGTPTAYGIGVRDHLRRR